MANTLFGKKSVSGRQVVEEASDEKVSKKGVKSSCLKVLVNILLIMAAGLVCIWLALTFLKGYTRFGQAVEVPPINGLSRAAAESELSKRHLKMEIIDSVYVDSAEPGVVMDSNPKSGSKVKSNRVIFVTVNANNARQIALPQVIQLSRRQAIATLRGAGFVNVSERFVPGEFNDLVIAIKDGVTGGSLLSGKRMAVNAPIVIEVSSATLMDSLLLVQEAMEADSLLRLSGGNGDTTVQSPQEPADPSTPKETPQETPDTPENPDPDDWF